jgi:hypothetical protein
MQIPEFRSRDTLRKLWWTHDAFWHAALVRELGHERANQINLEAAEKLFRMLTITLLRQKIISRPKSIEDLMSVFKVVWKNAFFDDLYVHEPISIKGNRAVWTGSRCHVYDSLKQANLLEGYTCGCSALRTGVMKVLRLKPLHEIKESLINGDGRCVIQVTFAPMG